MIESQFQLGDIAVEIILKDIKNVYLAVDPRTGRVRISAPRRTSLNTIRAFAKSKLNWIIRQRTKLRDEAWEIQRGYLDGETHYVWGKRVLLKLVEENGFPSVELRRSKLVVRVRPGADQYMREEIVSCWYRELLREAVPTLIETWEQRLEVVVNGFNLRQMKTLWGSCNPKTRTIRLNTELAKKPKGCLEYIVLHEMVHLIEGTHGPKFKALMDIYMPTWQVIRQELNRLPIGSVDWAY